MRRSVGIKVAYDPNTDGSRHIGLLRIELAKNNGIPLWHLYEATATKYLSSKKPTR